MFKKFNLTLYNVLSNVKKRDTIAIYGTSKEALEIKKYIYEKRKDVLAKIEIFIKKLFFNKNKICVDYKKN